MFKDPFLVMMLLVMLLAVAGFAAWQTHALDRFTKATAPQDSQVVRMPID